MQLRPESGVVVAGQQYAHAVPEASYAKCGDLSLAYQVFGDGPVELVSVGPMVRHIELIWTVPDIKAFVDQLARFCARVRQGRGRTVGPGPARSHAR
jgi:hypothetical protein